MEDDTNSIATGQAALAYYIRSGYTRVSLAGQEPTREGGSLGLLREGERPPLTPSRGRFLDSAGHSCHARRRERL